MTAPPWPDVPECYGHRHGRGLPAACQQCDGGHTHDWAAWHDGPKLGPGVPVRCRVCGGRKCDVPACTNRRHHSDPHTLLTGGTRPVGAPA